MPAPPYVPFADELYDVLRNGSEEEVTQHIQRLSLTPSEANAVLEMQAEAKRSSRKRFGRRLLTDAPRGWPFEVLGRPGQAAAQKRVARAFTDYLRGKSVVLTGPASYMIGGGRGAAIDGHDVVVRLNFQWPVPAALSPDLGERLDVLFHCCNGDFPVERLLSDERFSRLRFAGLEHNAESRRLREGVERAGGGVLNLTSYCLAVARSTGSWPSTGLTAIHCLLAQPLERLTIMGLTGQTTPYYPGYLGTAATQNLWRHDPLAQARYLLDVARRDARVELDPVARDVLQSYVRKAP